MGNSNNGSQPNPCESDWIPFSDKKCFKVLETKGTAVEANENCTQMDSSLVNIESKNEQDFLSDRLKSYRYISNFAWIGLEYRNNSFEWTDGTDSLYENWGENAIRDGLSKCAHMSLAESDLGQWMDDHCNRKYLVVCQKRQSSTSDLANQVANLTKIVEKQQGELNSLKNGTSNGYQGNYTEMDRKLRNLKSELGSQKIYFEKLFESVSDPFWQFKRNFDSKQFVTNKELNDLRLTINQEKQGK